MATPLSIPCSQVIRGCDCTLDPVSNYSAENPDHEVFYGQYNWPPVSGTFFAPGCLGQCESTISQEDADECAQRQAVECSDAGDTRGGTDNGVDGGGGGGGGGGGDGGSGGDARGVTSGAVPRPTFYNEQQQCVVECPDGATFGWIVPAHTVASPYQGDADARAYALACKRAKAHRICFVTDSPLTPVCVGEFASIPIIAQGGESPYTYALILGSIPIGMTFDPVGLIQGTPVAAVTTMFTVEVTDAIGSTQSKQFTLQVVEIASPTALPNGTQNTVYSYTLLTAGTSGTVVWSLASGALPDGLTLSTAGVISGTPTVPGSFSFNLSLIDGAGASCSKDFTLQVAPAILILAYWQFESYAASIVPDATPNGFDLTGNNVATIVPGVVANGLRPSNATELDIFAGSFALFNNCAATGFTMCGWFKLDVPDNAGDGNIVGNMAWFAPVSSWFLEILNGDLLVNISGEDFSSQTITYPNPQDGAWHFYRIWYTPSDQKMHMQLDNGLVMDSASIPIASGNYSQLFLCGNAIFGGGTFRYLDETGFWKRVLSNTEASNLYNGGAGLTYGNPGFPP